MNELNEETAAEPEGGSDKIRLLQPVLFIGVGGTGMEVLLRVRRRILHATWGSGEQTHLDSLESFPVAEFLHFDLDQNARMEGGRSASDDPLSELVKLPQQDRIVTALDPMKYLRSADDLNRYPHVESWCPLNGEIAQGLNLKNGAGQLRAMSRLYFFDVYSVVRETILQKLRGLQANRDNHNQLKKLGLEVDNTRVRVMVVCSCAGGTGSGSFLDFGWLAQKLAKETFNAGNYSVELILFTPRGYEMANADRTKANGYAALMELETCMNKFPDYVGTWDRNEGRVQVDETPYTDVYIVESANIARDALKGVDDVYEMVADILFEDFASEEFANYKRSASVNQKQHKASPYNPPLPAEYGETLRLTYSMGYSAFGQAMLDTKRAQQQEQDEYRLVSAMLEAFFGIAGTDKSSLQATDQKRDDFLREHLKLAPYTFSQFPDFSKNKELQNLCAPFLDNQLTVDMLHDDQGGIEEAIQQKINALVESIKADQSTLKDWPTLLRKRLPALEQDVIRTEDTAAITCEDRIMRRGEELKSQKYAVLRQKLYEYLDNKDYGGLEYVFSLADLLRTSFINPTTGLVQQLDDNALRYRRIRDALKTRQLEETLNNIASAVKGGIFSGPDVKNALVYMDALKNDLGDYLRFHARSVAASAAAAVLRDLAGRIGARHGTDDKNRSIYSGLLAEFNAGRNEVLTLSEEIGRTAKTIEDSQDKSHVNYIFVETERTPLALPDTKTLRAWATEALKDFEGSQRIFPMLRTAEGKAKLLGKLRMRATHTRIVQQSQQQRERKDPLVAKLLQMETAGRMSKFRELLRASMPWIDANFTDVQPKPDRFKCYLGVMDPDDWDPLLEELRSCLPTECGITATQFQLKKTGIPGRAVCYAEYSGFPINVLRGLGEWRTKYRLESRNWPLHTHKDPTLFVHPLVPTTMELKQSSADMRLFLLAVMLRKLVRSPRRTTPPGLYQFDYGRGDWRSLGNERAFRLNGIPPEFRIDVERSVNNALDKLDPLQLQALAHLTEYLHRETYAPAVHITEFGVHEERPGFMFGVTGQLHAELNRRVRNLGLEPEEAAALEKHLADWGEGWADVKRSYSKWTEIIPDSNQDAFTWEVRRFDPEDVGGPDHCKRRVLREFFEPNWLRGLCNPAQPTGQPFAQPSPTLVQQLAPTPAPCPPPLAPPPLAAEWFVAINMQQSGPYDLNGLRMLVASGHLTPASMVWKPGLAAWAPASQMPELCPLFMAPPPLGMVPPPL